MEGKDDCYFTASVFRWILVHVPRGRFRIRQDLIRSLDQGGPLWAKKWKNSAFSKIVFFEKISSHNFVKNPIILEFLKANCTSKLIALFFKFQSTMNHKGCPFLISHFLVINSFLKNTPHFSMRTLFTRFTIIDFTHFLRKIYLRSTSFLSQQCFSVGGPKRTVKLWRVNFDFKYMLP